jgi:hypothetical protein
VLSVDVPIFRSSFAKTARDPAASATNVGPNSRLFIIYVLYYRLLLFASHGLICSADSNQNLLCYCILIVWLKELIGAFLGSFFYYCA